MNFDREFPVERASSIVSSQAAKQSTEQQQRDIFDSHRHRAFSLAFYMTGNEMEAEEILSDTFVRAFQLSERPDAFAVDSALIGELNDRFSLEQETAPAIAPQRSGPVSAPGSSQGRSNIRRGDLEAAVQRLPAKERLLFLLRDVEGYPPEKIAILLAIPQSQVERGLFSARIRLCQILAALARPNTEAA